jgi:DNA-binding response OmpR family regulator
MSRVLIVEDEAHLAQGLRFNLEAEGHSVEVAGDGERAIELLLGQKQNGQKEDSKRGGNKREQSKREEFDAIVLAVMLPACVFHDLVGHVVALREAGLLLHLIPNSVRVVPRKVILEEVWGLHEDTDTRAIDNFIVRLRRYIEDDPAKPKHLLTVRGVGYRFVSEPREDESPAVEPI